MRKLALFVLVFAAGLVHASQVQIINPVQSTLSEGDTVDLGVVGPGQRIEVEMLTRTGENDWQNKEKDWDRVLVEPETLPGGWRHEDGLLYEKKMKAIVIVSKDAPDDEYTFSLHTFDEYEGTQPLRFNAKVRVSRDVFQFNVVQETLSAGIDQPAVYTLKFRNLGSASDAFRIEVTGGLPSQWRYTKDVFVPHNSEREAQYELAGTEQGEFNVQFKATSLSSERIYGEDEAGLQVQSNLIEDMKATGRGMLLFPSIEQIVYNLLGLIAVNAFP